jgi:transposase
MAMPGIGPLIASAMIAAIGDGTAFIKGRDFAAWLGLVPKQISTGDRTILGSISRRSLRTLFVVHERLPFTVLLGCRPAGRFSLRVRANRNS